MINKQEKKFNHYFQADGKSKRIYTSLEKSDINELMKDLNYTDTKINGVNAEIKKYEKKYEEESIKAFMDYYYSILFTEEELATIEYAGMIVQNKSEAYKGLVECLSLKLKDLDFFIKQLIYVKKESELNISIIDAIKSIFDDINEDVANFYDIHRAEIFMRNV